MVLEDGEVNIEITAEILPREDRARRAEAGAEGAADEEVLDTGAGLLRFSEGLRHRKR